MRIETSAFGSRWPHWLSILACALIAILPLAIRGNSCGHDFDFHLQSWLAVAQSWHHGVFYPHWIDGANYGAGEPRFVFYPPLTWLFGALLGNVLPWAVVPSVFTFIVLAACGLSMNKVARQWLPTNAAVVAGCVYMLNPYALFVAYERTAYAELAAGIWLPLIALYALRNSTPIHSERSEAKLTNMRFASASTEAGAPGPDFRKWVLLNNSTIPLALTIAAIWLTNAPAAVMACYTLGAIAIWQSVVQRHWRPILNSAIGLALGLGLASFYLVPAAYERRWVDIARAIGPGMRIQDSFLFGHTGESFHDQVLRTASWIFVTMLAGISISVAIASRRKAAPRFLIPLSVAAVVLFAVQLPWSNTIWRIAPELGFLQFPWRWTLVLSIVLSLAIGFAASTLSGRPQERGFGPHAAAILVLAMAASLASYLFWQRCDEEDAVSAQMTVFRSRAGFEGTDEYTPAGADNSLIQQGLPQIRTLRAADSETAPGAASEDQANPVYAPRPQDQIAAHIQIQQWLSERKQLTITTRSPGFAILRLMDYPAWHLRLNGTSISDRLHRDDGLITVPIAVGTNRIELIYAASGDVWRGRGFSVASLLALIALALVTRKRRHVV